MGMIDTAITRAAHALGFEKRATYASGQWGTILPQGGGVSIRAAENLATVLGCTQAISSALAYIPALTYQRDGDGNRREAMAHPLATITRMGTSAMSWPELIEHWVASALLTGNGLIEIVRDERGMLIDLKFHPWGCVSVQLLSSGRLAYDVTEPRIAGRMRRLLQDEVIHLRDRTDDGSIGRSRLSRASDTVAGVVAANSFAKSILDNGGYPSGVLTYPGAMSAEQASRLREDFNRKHTGTDNAGRVMILDGGLAYTVAQISPEDAELLESRRFGVEEICRLYQVPPPLVQDYSHNTFTNSETAGRWFAQFTLAPWARKIEAAFSRALFPAQSGLELEMDLSGFLRGDPTARWQSHKIAIETGVLDPDEVRHVEGWNPRVKASGL
jgi:HK97 family phage portal protein